MARPRKQDQFAALPDNDCDERIVHLEAVHQARLTQPAPDDLAELSSLLALMADPTRLRIVAALDTVELCVCDLSAATAESQPKVSRHMALLRESGLVIDRREGKWVHYRLSPNMPAWAAAVIDTSWNCLREETRMKLKNRLPGSC